MAGRRPHLSPKESRPSKMPSRQVKFHLECGSIEPYLQVTTSLNFPTSLNTCKIPTRFFLNALWCQQWNTSVAYVQKMPYTRGLGTATSNAFPLCSLEDSGSHSLGGCRRQGMVKSCIQRDNEAGRLMLIEKYKRHRWPCVCIADPGKK